MQTWPCCRYCPRALGETAWVGKDRWEKGLVQQSRGPLFEGRRGWGVRKAGCLHPYKSQCQWLRGWLEALKSESGLDSGLTSSSFEGVEAAAERSEALWCWEGARTGWLVGLEQRYTACGHMRKQYCNLRVGEVRAGHNMGLPTCRART